MKRKVITVRLTGFWIDSYLTMYGNHFICVHGLKEFFELEDTPREIDVVLTAKPYKDSYKITPYINKRGTPRAKVLLSDGTVQYVQIYRQFYDALKSFGDECYVAIEA